MTPPPRPRQAGHLLAGGQGTVRERARFGHRRQGPPAGDSEGQQGDVRAASREPRSRGALGRAKGGVEAGVSALEDIFARRGGVIEIARSA